MGGRVAWREAERERGKRFVFVSLGFPFRKKSIKYFFTFYTSQLTTQTPTPATTDFSLSQEKFFLCWHFAMYNMNSLLGEGKYILTHIRKRKSWTELYTWCAKRTEFPCKKCARLKHNVYEILDLITGRKNSIFFTQTSLLLSSSTLRTFFLRSPFLSCFSRGRRKFSYAHPQHTSQFKSLWRIVAQIK